MTKLRQICEQEENEEHVHGDDCYERVLNCAIPEHIHTDACYPAATEAPVTEEPYVIEATVAAEEPEETPVPEITEEPTATEAPAEQELPSDAPVQVDETPSVSKTPAPEPANDDASGRVLPSDFFFRARKRNGNEGRRETTMAIYHFSTKVISISTGRTAVGAAAYMSCSAMTSEYDGIHHDYTRKARLGY